jgi:hypothetical protein
MCLSPFAGQVRFGEQFGWWGEIGVRHLSFGIVSWFDGLEAILVAPC